MTAFAETMAARELELDINIALILDDVERRVRRDLVATAHPDDSPDWIEQNVDAVLSLQRADARAWRSRELMRYALALEVTPKESRCRS